jgi:hypothetical protein
VGKNAQYAKEVARLHDHAAECRRKAVETQLSLALTLSALAETEIRYGRPREALKLASKLRHHADTIRTHLKEPDHLPKIALSELNKQLVQLENRIEAVESCLRQP